MPRISTHFPFPCLLAGNFLFPLCTFLFPLLRVYFLGEAWVCPSWPLRLSWGPLAPFEPGHLCGCVSSSEGTGALPAWLSPAPAPPGASSELSTVCGPT